MRKSVLLLKGEVGKSKPSTIDLPDKVYGKRSKPDDFNVAKCKLYI